MNQNTSLYLGSLTRCNLGLLALTLLLTPKFTPAQTAGTLDPTFGTGGTVTTFFGGDGLNGDEAHAIVVQANGKLVVAEYTTNLDDTTDFALARYNTNGTLDSTFGTGGETVTDFGADDRAFSMALQADGKIVAAGMTGTNFALARYKVNGTHDGTFGSGGKVITDFGGLNDVALGVAVRTDGKIVAVGRGTTFALARYNSNGTLGTAFGNAGRMTTHFASSLVDQAFAVAIQADGKAVVVGGADINLVAQFRVARYQ